MNALNGNGILLLEQRKVTHLEVTDGSLPLPVFYVQSQRMGTKKMETDARRRNMTSLGLGHLPSDWCNCGLPLRTAGSEALRP